MSRPLDRARPLWEMYLVEGLSGDRFAVLSKTHHAVVDGVSAVDIGAVILDDTPEPRDTLPDEWQPAPEPGWHALVAGALADGTPAAIARRQLPSRHRRRRAHREPGVRRPQRSDRGRDANHGPAGAEPAAQRPDQRTTPVRDGGHRSRHLPAHPSSARRHGQRRRAGHRRWCVADLAVDPRGASSRFDVDPGPGAGECAPPGREGQPGEPDLVIPRRPARRRTQPGGRLQRISHAMRAHKDSGQAVAAEALVGLAGFAPPTLHALGARVASSMSRRVFNLIVTNVPGRRFLSTRAEPAC